MTSIYTLAGETISLELYSNRHLVCLLGDFFYINVYLLVLSVNMNVEILIIFIDLAMRKILVCYIIRILAFLDFSVLSWAQTTYAEED